MQDAFDERSIADAKVESFFSSSFDEFFVALAHSCLPNEVHSLLACRRDYF
jgi:hypothetical protein